MANTTKKGKTSRRLDKNRLTLRKGETQRKDGTYDFRWTSADGKRHSIYAATLQELREKEEEIIRDKQSKQIGTDNQHHRNNPPGSPCGDRFAEVDQKHDIAAQKGL